MTPRYSALGPQGFGTYGFDPVALRLLERVDAPADYVIVPGFVDVHIHGAFGIDLMTAELSDVARLTTALEDIGYEAFLPTTVTSPASVVMQAVSCFPSNNATPGFHLEGPFISPLHPGAQPPRDVCDPMGADSEWDSVLDHPGLRIVTLAPERPGAEGLVRRLVSRGVHVSMGHTDATYAQASEGFRWGVRGATHTYNAMRPFHHREAGAVGLALLEDGLFAEIIYDGHHVTKEAASLLFRSKPADKVIAVSDSTMATGLADGAEVEMWGHACSVSGGTVRLKSKGALAGSASTLADCFRNLYADFGPEAAIRAACLNPRQLVGSHESPRVWVVLDRALDICEVKRQNPLGTGSGSTNVTAKSALDRG